MAMRFAISPSKSSVRGSSLVFLCVLVGISIGFSTQQLGDVKVLMFPASPDSVEISPSLEKNEKESDLVLWSSKPIILEKGVEPSSFIVSRKFSQDVNAMLWEMDEVVRVDFRLCNHGKCPTPPNTRQMMSKDEIQLLPQYQRNKDRVLQVFVPINGQISKQSINFTNLEAVTFWSDRHQQHIPVEYPRTIIPVISCFPQNSCPDSCPENRQNPDWTYPYLYDTKDRICKSSHPDANPPRRRFGGFCRCESTCFTAEATAINSTWPWKSAAERDFLVPHWKNQIEVRNAAKFHRLMGKRRQRDQQYGTYQARFTCPNQTLKSSPTFGDFKHHLFFIPEAKLIFCGIPKVGITEWIKFFRYVMGAKDYLSLPHFKNDRAAFFMKSLHHSKAEELLNDRTWTKAVFFRNPFERLLSSYIDKIVGQSYTQKVFNISAPKGQKQPVLTFAEFVDKLTDNATMYGCNSPNGLGACTDPHWKPQVMTCGLDQLLPKFDFIASFDHISEHTRILLERVGLWEKYGATFDDGQGAEGNYNMCRVPPPKRTLNETVWGFNQKGPSLAGKHLHATGSRSRFSEFYTPELMEKVREAYALDFAVWDEISSKDRHVDEIMAGKDLKVVREYCEGQ